MNIKKRVDKGIKKVTRFIGATKRKLSDKTPDILQGVGTLGVITGFGLCIKSSFKAKEVIDEKGVNKETAIEMAEIYTPPVAVTAVSLMAFRRSHKIMKERYASRIAAFVSVSNAFRRYRLNVKSAFGDDVERAMSYGGGTIKTDKLGKDGKIHKKSIDIQPGLYSEYARYYTKDNIKARFRKDLSLNMYQIQQVEHSANMILQARGYIFLNEIYDMLGLSRTLAGQSVGWMLDGNGDGKVVISRYVIHGRDYRIPEDLIIVDFNVDGFIRDKRLVDFIEVLL